jgi:hypothetical protein
MPETPETYEITYTVRACRGMRFPADAEAQTVIRRTDSAREAEEIARAAAQEHRTSAVVERVGNWANESRREHIGVARLDAFERVWFDLMPAGAALL